MFTLLTKISLKLDSIGNRVQALESLPLECINLNNLNQPHRPKTHESVNMTSSFLEDKLVKPKTFEPLPPISSKNKQAKFIPEIVKEDLKSSHSSEEEIKNNEHPKHVESKNLNYENPVIDNKLENNSAKNYHEQNP